MNLNKFNLSLQDFMKILTLEPGNKQALQQMETVQNLIRNNSSKTPKSILKPLTTEKKLKEKKKVQIIEDNNKKYPENNGNE